MAMKIRMISVEDEQNVWLSRRENASAYIRNLIWEDMRKNKITSEDLGDALGSAEEEIKKAEEMQANTAFFKDYMAKLTPEQRMDVRREYRQSGGNVTDMSAYMAWVANNKRV